MTNGHGGARKGAGRPRKERPATAAAYDSAQAYLEAVIAGREEPDALRIAAAKALLLNAATKCTSLGGRVYQRELHA